MAPSWTPDQLPDLAGRTYVVTGGNAGIGYWTVLHLARHHAKVFLGCRNAGKGREAVNSILRVVPEANVELLVMDLMDLRSVIAAATELVSKTDRLHGLVNNAGIMATPLLITKDGYESQFQTNYLSHWVLTHHLLPKLQATAATCEAGAVRIVNVSSTGHMMAPTGDINFEDTSLKDAFTFKRYGQSKLANILHSRALEQRYGPLRLDDRNQTSRPLLNVAVHPGNVDTQINDKSWGGSLAPVLRFLGVYTTPEQGSFTSLYAVAGPFAEEDSGAY